MNSEVDPAAGAPVDHAGLDILPEEECIDLMRSVAVARIGFVAQDEVVVLPVNISWWEDGVVFSTATGSKLHAAAMGRPVVVEADGFDDAAKSGWSVLGGGTASVVADSRSIASLDRLGVRSWVRPEVPKHWVHVRLKTSTGRRTPAAAAS